MRRIPNDSSTTPVTDTNHPGLQDREIKEFIVHFFYLKFQGVKHVKMTFPEMAMLFLLCAFQFFRDIQSCQL